MQHFILGMVLGSILTILILAVLKASRHRAQERVTSKPSSLSDSDGDDWDLWATDFLARGVAKQDEIEKIEKARAKQKQRMRFRKARQRL